MTSTPGETEQTRSPAPGGLFLLGALLVAGFLLFGAFAKSYTMLGKTEPKAGEALRMYGQAGVEALLALLILARCRWSVTWACVALLFSGFAGATMHRMLGGYSSCGCFGKFHVAPPVTLSIDTAIVMLGVGLARLAGLRGGAAAWVAALAIPMAVTGSLVSKQVSEPPPWAFKAKAVSAIPTAPAVSVPQEQKQAFKRSEGAAPPSAGAATPPSAPAPAVAQAGADLTAQEDLLNVPARAAAALAGKPGPAWLAPLTEAGGDKDASRAWLLFVYDPDCHVCQQFIPAMAHHEAVESLAPGAKLRVIMLKKNELEKFDIQDWAWPASPTVVLVRAGKVVHEWGGEKSPDVMALHRDIDAKGAAYLDELEKTHKVLAPE